MNMLNLKHFLPGKKTRMSLVALVFGIVTIVSMLGATQVLPLQVLLLLLVRVTQSCHLLIRIPET